jgi:predicted permease
MLARSPGFTAVAVVTLAIGIGANTVLFSAIDTLVLRRLPYPHADRLVMPTPTILRGNQTQPQSIMTWSYPKFRTLLDNQDLFEDVTGFRDLDVNLTGVGKAERLLGELATQSYFPLLGVSPVVGRTFSAEEDRAGGPQVVILGHSLWRRAFGGDPAVVGRTLHLSGQTVTVVGVLPAGFRGLSGTSELWLPVAMAPKLIHPKMLEMRWAHWLQVVARLKPGASTAMMTAGMAALGKIIDAAHPSPSAGDKWGATAVPLDEARRDPKVRTAVLVLFGAVALVLLIGCVNVAHLTLSRAAARRQEIAVRLSLGATRGRVVRQLVTESALLAIVGGTVGLLFAAWGLDVVRALRPDALEGYGVSTTQIRDLEGVGLNPAVLAYTFGLSLVAGIAFGLAPAMRATRVDLHTELKMSGVQMSQPVPARGVLAATEIAFALVLVAGAGLLLRGLGHLTSVDLGVRTDHVLTFRVDRAGEETAEDSTFGERLLERVAAIPGVEAVGTDICAPTQGHCDRTGVIQVEGRAKYTEGSEPEIDVHFVTPDYFRTLAIPLVRGRTFTSADRKGSRQVIVINERAARKLFPGEDPVGKRMHAGYGAPEDMSEIIGVVADVRYGGPDEAAGPDLFAAQLQDRPHGRMVFARTHGDPASYPAAMRAAVESLDPDLPIYSVCTLEEITRDATARPRFATLLLTGFAAIAVFLAALGVYGVMAATVTQRRREIGIRMALGADARRVMALLLREGAWIAAAGVLAGLAAALALSHVLSGFLYGVSEQDPATFAGVAALLGGIALGACWLAARRATRVQPLEAMRNDG